MIISVIGNVSYKPSSKVASKRIFPCRNCMSGRSFVNPWSMYHRPSFNACYVDCFIALPPVRFWTLPHHNHGLSVCTPDPPKPWVSIFRDKNQISDPLIWPNRWEPYNHQYRYHHLRRRNHHRFRLRRRLALLHSHRIATIEPPMISIGIIGIVVQWTEKVPNEASYENGGLDGSSSMECTRSSTDLIQSRHGIALYIRHGTCVHDGNIWRIDGLWELWNSITHLWDIQFQWSDWGTTHDLYGSHHTQ